MAAKKKLRQVSETEVITSEAHPIFGSVPGDREFVDVFRTAPDGFTGYLGRFPVESVDLPGIKDAWGGRKFRLSLLPPPGTDEKPIERHVEIDADPVTSSKSDNGQGSDPALAGILAELMHQRQVLAASLEKEVPQLLAMQRTQSDQMLTTFGKMADETTKRLVETARADRERDRQWHADQMERDASRHAQAMESQRADAKLLLEMSKGKNLDVLELLTKGVAVLEIVKPMIAPMLGQLMGGGDRNLAEVITESAPKLLESWADLTDRHADAKARLLEARAKRRALLTNPEQIADQVDQVEDLDQVDQVEPAAEQEDDEDDPDWAAFYQWIAMMKLLPFDQWGTMIRRQWEANALPLLLRESLTKANETRDLQDLAALFEDAGESALLTQALPHMGSHAVRAAPGMAPDESPRDPLPVESRTVEPGRGPGKDAAASEDGEQG